MPKLSSADTPPEWSSECLPVSTIALSGVITRIPLVCWSIVASAFQYGWAPTLIPASMMLASPPPWVKVISRRSALATPSMFSVPLSIEIFAPEDNVNHSTGTPHSSARSIAATTIAHSATATVPRAFVGSPNNATLVMPSGYFAVGVVTTPATTPAVFLPRGRSTGPNTPSVKSCSVKLPSAPVSIGTISYGYTAPCAPDRCTFWVYSSNGANASVGGSVTVTITPAP